MAKNKLILLCYFVGITVLSFGIALAIKSNIGAGAWNDLAFALFKRFGLTVGIWIFISSTVVMFINAWLVRKRPDYLGLATMILISFIVDFWFYFVFDELIVSTQLFSYLCLFTGLISIAIGVSLYLQVSFGKGPIDHLMLAISERFKVSHTTSKFMSEAIIAFVAFLLGGTVGMGTLLITLFIPLLINFLYNKIKYFVELSSK